MKNTPERDAAEAQIDDACLVGMLREAQVAAFLKGVAWGREHGPEETAREPGVNNSSNGGPVGFDPPSSENLPQETKISFDRAMGPDQTGYKCGRCEECFDTKRRAVAHECVPVKTTSKMLPTGLGEA